MSIEPTHDRTGSTWRVPGARCAVVVLSGSSGRLEAPRARLLAACGVTARAHLWFGAPGQPTAPVEVPLETTAEVVRALRVDHDRVVVLGTSFGAELALALAGSGLTPIDAVVAVAPPAHVWAGVRDDGTQTSHWTLRGEPLPFVALDEEWTTEARPPAYRELYAVSLAAAERDGTAARAELAAEGSPELLVVTGGDDQVWPAGEWAPRLIERRARQGLSTRHVHHRLAGHRVLLPGEEPVAGGASMRRGGTPEHDAALGRQAWPEVARLLGVDAVQ